MNQNAIPVTYSLGQLQVTRFGRIIEIAGELNLSGFEFDRPIAHIDSNVVLEDQVNAIIYYLRKYVQRKHKESNLSRLERQLTLLQEEIATLKSDNLI